MKHITLLCLILGWAAVAVADDSDLAAARKLLLEGKHAEAREAFAELVPDDPAAVVGLCRAWAAEGEYEKAMDVLLPAAGTRADVHAEIARLAFARGNFTMADAHAELALAFDPEQLLARWIRAELLRATGELQEANDAYHWLVTYYNGHVVEDAEQLRWIGLAAAQFARWNRLSNQFGFLVNELYPDALKADAAYWPARLEAGRLFLEKYNRADAQTELQAGLKLNSNAAELHAASARLALDGREFDQAERSVRRALELNPRLLEALLVKADLAWANFDPPEARRILQEEALAVNPRSEEALGRLAACLVLDEGLPEEGEYTDLSRLVERAEFWNPRPGLFYFSLASWMEERHKIDEAEHYFRKAIEVMPQLVGPRSELGLLYMHAGREDDAAKVLDEAFDVDPFNVRVNNSLEVLDVLAELESRDTGSCVLKFDPAHDKLLARYAADYMETTYKELCTQFGYKPPDKPLVEVFSTSHGASGHQWFSTRMIGLPYLGTVAASTGKIVAMVSPNDGGAKGAYNWARVLRHELVHVVTLQQTKFNCPHWYTEALAVHSEGEPRPRLWNEILVRRVPAGELFNLDTINFGFTRAQSGDDWQMAYCQAELYLDYMLDRWDEGVIGKLLGAYAEGLTTDEAIPKVFGTGKEEFEKGYLAYVEKIVAGLSGIEAPAKENFVELLKARREKPDDPEAALDLAYAYLRRNAAVEARKLADEVLQKHPDDQRAAYVLARLDIRAGRTREAIELLARAIDEESPDPKALNLLASLELKAEEFAEASRLYELGAQRHPNDPRWIQALARVYLAAEDEKKLAEALGRLAEMEGDDLETRKKLAQMALERKDFEEAARWANQALHIDVTDGEVHRVLAEALVGSNNHARAIEEFEIAVELDPKEPQRRFALADAYLQAERPADARRALKELLEIDPEYPGAKLLLESLDEEPPSTDKPPEGPTPESGDAEPVEKPPEKPVTDPAENEEQP